MLELIAVCYLAGQTLFAIPEGWRAVEVYSGGAQEVGSGIIYVPGCLVPGCEAERRRTWVHLKRTVQVGETIKGPHGCELTAKVRD